MIVTALTLKLLDMYAVRLLGRKLTEEELKKIMTYNGNRFTYTRNKYYRDMNKIAEEAIREVAKNEKNNTSN